VAATAAALLFGCGLLIGGIGLALRQSILVFLGMGVIGGMGCGLGYIAPVSTREARFQSPYAARVPATVAIAVETTAMTALFQAASSICVSRASAAYHLKENPSHSVKREALTLKTMRVMSGTCRNANATAA
jgi:hypothetical protein